MTNFHEFVHLHESQTARRAQPGVSPRCSNIRWQVLCHRCSKPARHITSLLTKTSDREESGVRRRGRGELPEVVNTKCKKQFGPDISVINFMPVLGPSHYKSNQIKSVRPPACAEQPPAMPDTPTVSSIHTPRKPGNGWGRSRDVWPAGGPSLETQLSNFYIKGHCDCLKVSLKYREGFVQYWFNAHFQF